MVATLSSFNFGEYEARREFTRSRSYFMDTFRIPLSFSMETLHSSRNFIIVGRKGSGKTSSQIYLRSRKTEEGYICGDIVFDSDIKASDYASFAQSQSSIVDIRSITSLHDISIHYDFRSIWRRIILVKIADVISLSGIENSFTQFCSSTKSGTNSILDGIKKGLKIESRVGFGIISTKLSFDASSLSAQSLSIDDFNKIAFDLLLNEMRGLKLYLFVDELVISTMNTKGDEYRLRLSLIRDLVKCCATLNDEFVKGDLDASLIVSLRPEVRHRLNLLDKEIGKIVDGNDVLITWESESSPENHPLSSIMRQKIRGGSRSGPIDVSSFFDPSISFGGKPQPIFQFFLNNSWHRPRDFVRFLKCFAKICPSDTKISEAVVKKSLNEYSRVSAKELLDELSVKMPQPFISALPHSISKKKYSNLSEFSRHLKSRSSVDATDYEIGQEFFELGIISNVSADGQRYFSSYRQEEHLMPDMPIQVHAGLWNYFNIRHT